MGRCLKAHDGSDSIDLVTENDAGGPGRPERRPMLADGGTDTGDDSPIEYQRGEDDYRLRPGISKVDPGECPACGGGLVHLPGRDPVNPYTERAMIMCEDCYRAVLIEVLEEEEPGADTPDPEEGEQATLFAVTGAEEPDGAAVDPEYDREHAGYESYGYSGPVGVQQERLSDTADRLRDEDDEEPEVRTDGGVSAGGAAKCSDCKQVFVEPPESTPESMACPECGGTLLSAPDGEVGRERDRSPDPEDPTVDRYIERFETGVRIKTKIQRGTGTNDRDTVTGEVRRRSLGEAAGELSALEEVMRGHLYEIRGWDGDGEYRALEDAAAGGED